MERFFVVAGRINTILVLLILLGLAVALGYFAIETMTRQARSPSMVTDNIQGNKLPTPLDLGHAVDINGTDTTMIELRTEGGYSKLASGHGAGQTRNVLFITGREKKANWLFKDHKHLILASEQVRKVHMSADHPTLALYVHYIAADTNGDGELSEGDNATLGITKPDGSGLVPAVQDVGRIISHEMENDDQLSFVYRQGTTLRHARFSLLRFQLDSDREILNVAQK